MTEFKAGEHYIYTHRTGADSRSGGVVTITEEQYEHSTWIRGRHQDGTIGAFYPDELTKKKEDSVTEIKVGDTVRIKKNYPYAYRGNEHGIEFEVTAVHGTVNGGSKFFVEGDPRGSGIWEEFIEKVEPDTRWRYNDHIVVYPETRDQQGRGRGVTVLDETPLPKVYTRWEDQPYATDEITEAARAYWAAHPKPKPQPTLKEQFDALPVGAWFTFDGKKDARIKLSSSSYHFPKTNFTYNISVLEGQVGVVNQIDPEAAE